MALRSLTKNLVVPRTILTPFTTIQRSMSTKPLAQIKSLDHLVLTVKSIPATRAFYCDHLGMKFETFKSGTTTRHALSFGSQKINLHELGSEFEPKAKSVCPGSGDVCFIAETDVEEVLRGLEREGIEVLEGGKVVERTGAVGKLRSVYVRDPDGNLVEISNYET